MPPARYLTLLAVQALEVSGFKGDLVFGARIALIAILIIAAIAMLWRPLASLRPNRRVPPRRISPLIQSITPEDQGEIRDEHADIVDRITAARRDGGVADAGVAPAAPAPTPAQTPRDAGTR